VFNKISQSVSQQQCSVYFIRVEKKASIEEASSDGIRRQINYTNLPAENHD